MDKRSSFGVALKAVIWQNGKFLILKRSKPSSNHADLWEFPGGGLEIGEKHEIALVREILEETSLSAKPIKPLSVWDAKRRDGVQVLGVTFLCDYLSGEVVLSEEHTDYAWISPHEIDQYPVFEQMANEVKSWSL